MSSVQDFKRLNNDNVGPNTGGMGCIAYENNSLPFLDNEDIYKCQLINQEIINHLNKYGKSNENKNVYNGILYGSFIKTYSGEIKVIEYNCRLGDPETMVILSLLQSNLYNMFSLMVNSCLDIYNESFSKNASLCLYYATRLSKGENNFK